MKLHLLHGPAVSNSRLKLTELKEKLDQDSLTVFDNGSNYQEIVGGLMTMPLLSENRVIVLENPDESWDFNAVGQHDLNLIIWLDHEIDQKKLLYKFIKDNNGKILFFPEGKEVSIFPFLDALGFKDKKAFVELKKLKDAAYDSQYLITMIFYLLRSLAVKSEKSPPFVQQKMAKQRQNFQDLPALYKYVLEADYKIKSGLLDPEQAEFSLVNAFVR